jgi:hypothetical protein
MCDLTLRLLLYEFDYSIRSFGSLALDEDVLVFLKRDKACN